MSGEQLRIDPLYNEANDPLEYEEYGAEDVQLLRTYEELKKIRKQFFKTGGLDFLVLIGPQSTGKSQTFTKGFSGWYHKGRITPRALYLDLYHHRNQPLILDDVQEILSAPPNVELLKSVCDTTHQKVVSWRTSLELPEGVPHTFDTTSRVAIITNSLGSVDAHLAAVLDRAFVFRFVPTALELHKYAGEWFRDKEVYDYIGERLGRLRRPACRLYYKAAKQKKLDPTGWREWIDKQLKPLDVMAVVRALEKDTRFQGRKEREVEAKKLLGLERAQYHNYLKLLTPEERAPVKRGRPSHRRK